MAGEVTVDGVNRHLRAFQQIYRTGGERGCCIGNQWVTGRPGPGRSGPSVGVGPDGPDRVDPGHPLGIAAQAVLENGGAGGMVEVCGTVCSDGIRIQSSG